MALDRDDLTSAVGALEDALSRGDSPRALAPLAEAQRLRGEVEEAIRTAESGLDAHPDHVGILIVLARALADAGRQPEAHRAYREVLERDPENLEARACLMPSEVPSEPATSELEPAAQGQSADRAGSLHEELEDLASLFSPRRPLDEAPDGSDVLSGIATLTLAEVYARQGMFERAVDVCETILERDPGDERARARLEEYRRELTAIR